MQERGCRVEVCLRDWFEKQLFRLRAVAFLRSDRLMAGVVNAEIDGKQVKNYDRERTICDLLLHRNKVDGEVFNLSIQRYIKDSKKVEAHLVQYAKLLHVEKKVRDTL